MQLTRIAAVALFAAALAACSKDSTPAPTAPDVQLRFARSTGPCTSGAAQAIADQQDVMYGGAVLDSARDLFGLVVHDCKTNRALAIEEMFAYVQFTIDFKASTSAISPKTTEGTIIGHWDLTFAYVGLATPTDDAGNSLPDAVLLSGGGAGVVTKAGGAVLTNPVVAGISVPAQGTSGNQATHLITINRKTGNCDAQVNLLQYGACYFFVANPKLGTVPFYLPATVGVCALPAKIDDETSLAHFDRHDATVIEPIGYPEHCDDEAITLASWNGGFRSFAKRLAQSVTGAFRVNRAYAAHSGEGGSGGFLSPFAVVDRKIFKGTFTADQVNTQPNVPDLLGTSWTIKIKVPSPATILVQSALGDPTLGLTDKPVVLSQAGGNCANCDSLKLVGNGRTDGLIEDSTVYDVQWSSLQDQPNTKGAPFLIMDSDGNEIARLTYTTKSNSNQLFYKGTGPAIFVGNWAQHVKQTFSIEVNFSTRKTSLSINGSPVAAATNVGFGANVKNLAKVGAVFSGIDAGIIGWDDITIIRRNDQ
jgi:hypothetical protein